MMPPTSEAASTSRTRRTPRRPSTSAHSIPAGPAPTTSTSESALAARSKRSGCQPRRCSSPAVAFCVQPMWRRLSPFEMHMLQPMHSRMSPTRPSSIFRGIHGSAMLGRAAPIRSHTPDSMISAIRSGDVSRPTPTIGFAVASRTLPVHSSCQPSEKNRDGPESFDHSSIEPMWTSHRSTRWSASRTNSSPSARSIPAPPTAEIADPAGDRAVGADGVAHRGERLDPHARPVLERAAVLVVALVVERREHLPEEVGVAAVDVDDVEPGVARADRGRHPVGDDPVDVPLLHPLRRDVREVACDLRGSRRRKPRLAVLAVRAGVRELDAGQRPVPVGRLRHERKMGEVVVVPHAAPR